MPVSKGFAIDLMDTINNEGNIYQELVERVEQIRKRNLICYFSFAAHPAGAIDEHDTVVLENILKSLDLHRFDGGLDLLINSPGGDPNAAEQIILTCRSFSTSFQVIVARRAMSAATLVAMGSDKIVMSNTSELGPIDPQMIQQLPNGAQILRPASSYIAAYLDLVNRAQQAILSQAPPDPFLALLQGTVDPSWIQVCENARRLSRTIAEDVLKRYMLSGKTDQQISSTIDNFIKVGELTSHGRVIRSNTAKHFGLEVDEVDQNSDLWKTVWELFMRAEHYLSSKRLAKYFICHKGGINVQAQVVRF